MTNKTDDSLMAEAVRDLSAAVSNALLYSPEHPQVFLHAGRAAARLGDIAATAGEAKLVLVDDLLFHGERPLGKTVFAKRLAHAMKSRGIGFFRFLRGADRRSREDNVVDVRKPRRRKPSGLLLFIHLVP
jgi:hypothetical protein